MRALLLFFPLALNTFAATPLIFGARGGAPLTNNNFDSLLGSIPASSVTHPFTIGPTVGVRLPLGLSVEGDALFNRQSLNIGQFGGFTAASTHLDSWEFPVMLKFTPGHGAIAPVVGAGVTVRHFNEFNQVPSFLFSGTTSNNPVGFVAGAGLRCKLGPVNITPELRYTRWGGTSFSQSFLDLLPLNRNEASILVGITF